MDIKAAQKKLHELLDAPTTGNLAEAKRVAGSLTEAAHDPVAEKHVPEHEHAPEHEKRVPEHEKHAPDNKPAKPAR